MTVVSSTPSVPATSALQESGSPAPPVVVLSLVLPEPTVLLGSMSDVGPPETAVPEGMVAAGSTTG